MSIYRARLRNTCNTLQVQDSARPKVSTYRWRRGVAVERRTCDQEVVGSSLGRAIRRKNSGQVSHTYVPLSPSSITWYRSKGGCLATGEQTNCGLCVGGRLKLCDPLVTHGPSLTSRCCPAWQLRLRIAVLCDRCWLSVCLDCNKGSLLLLLYYYA